jgi:hypothetical protein
VVKLRRQFEDLILGILLLAAVYFLSCYFYNVLYSSTLKFHSQKSQQRLQQCLKLHPIKGKKTVRILVISGGGVNGIIPLAFLDAIEKKTGRPTRELFDLFVATSTGTIIESFINMPKADGSYYSAHDLYNNYILDAKYFLASHFWRRFFTLDGILGPRLDIKQIYEQLKANPAMNNRFFEINKDVVFSNTRLNDLTLTMLKNWDCDDSRVYSPVSEIVTSTSALPLVFSPIDFFDEVGQKTTYADGAMYANRPFLEAIRLAKERHPSLEKIVIVFLSTGTQLRIPSNWDGSSFEHWGLIKWIPAVIQIMFTGQQYEAHEGIRAMLEFFPPGNLKYYHLNANWTKSPLNISPDNINNLVKAAQQAVVDHQQKIDNLVQDIND